MRINVKAALLSAFVLPGLGHLYKGKKVKGIVLICLANIFLLAALYLVLQTVGHLMAEGIGGKIDPTAALEDLKSRSPAARWLLTVFFGLWIYGIIDAARD